MTFAGVTGTFSTVFLIVWPESFDLSELAWWFAIGQLTDTINYV